MAEVNTTQGAKIVANSKLSPHESHGRQRVLASKMPAVYAQAAVNDTILIGRVPANTRFLSTSKVSCAAGTATGTLDIGLRETVTGTVISATGIAAGVDIAAAGLKDANTGVYLAAGAEYITLKECDVYATVKVAVLAANQSLRFELQYVTD